MRNFGPHWSWTLSSMFPTLSNRQHWLALCLASKGMLLLQRHSVPDCWSGYRRVSFQLFAKGSLTECFPHCLLQHANGEEASRRWPPPHRPPHSSSLRHEELVVCRCSPLPGTSNRCHRCDRCRQLAAWRFRNFSTSPTGVRSVQMPVKKRAAASCAAAVQLAARPAMV